MIILAVSKLEIKIELCTFVKVNSLTEHVSYQ